MTDLILHRKRNNIPDWTQAQLDVVVGGGAPPLLPPGTVLNDITLPSDWLDDHDVSGFLANENTYTAQQNLNDGAHIEKTIDVLTTAPSNLQFSSEGGVDGNGFASGDVVDVRVRSFKIVAGIAYGSTNPTPIVSHTFTDDNKAWDGSFDGDDWATIDGWGVEYSLNGGPYTIYQGVTPGPGSQGVHIENSTGAPLNPTEINVAVEFAYNDPITNRIYAAYSQSPVKFSTIFLDDPLPVSAGGTGQSDGTIRSNLNSSYINFYAGKIFGPTGPAYDYLNSLIYDSGGSTVAIDLVNRYLYNSSGTKKIDFHLGWYYDSGGNIRLLMNNDPEWVAPTSTNIINRFVPAASQAVDCLQFRNTNDSANVASFNKNWSFVARAGSTTALTAPIYFTSGSLMTSPEIGAKEFLTDKFYGTITTGTARKEFTLNDVALTSGRVPFNTTNGRLTDSSAFTFSGGTLSATTFSGSGASLTSIPLGSAVTGTLPFANGGNSITTADLTAQSAAVSSVVTVTSPNDGSAHQYQVGAYTAITAISAGTLTVQIAFTDENNTAQTISFFPMGITSAGLTTTGFTAFTPAQIRVKANTAITVKTTFTGVSITYDVGGSITRIN